MIEFRSNRHHINLYSRNPTLAFGGRRAKSGDLSSIVFGGGKLTPNSTIMFSASSLSICFCIACLISKSLFMLFSCTIEIPSNCIFDINKSTVFLRDCSPLSGLCKTQSRMFKQFEIETFAISFSLSIAKKVSKN